MSSGAVGFGRSFPATWVIPLTALLVLLGLAVAGVLSRSLIADLAAWWPVWLILAVEAVVLRNRRLGRVRVSGLVPLVATIAISVFAWAHLAGWALMPSAGQTLVGPDPEGVETAVLAVSVDGLLDISNGQGSLYRVEPIRKGGSVGRPTATESTTGSGIIVDLVADPEPGVFEYAGWTLSLAAGPSWDMRLDGNITGDLGDLDLSELHLDGGGEVELGSPAGPTTVIVDGNFVIRLPEQSPARVIGMASIPASWSLTEDGAVSPVDGEGWRIVVRGEATLTIATG